MNDNKKGTKKTVLKIVFLIAIIITLLLLLFKGCTTKKEIAEGIKIININEQVDSFNDDTIFVANELSSNKEYIYTITIHNYLGDDYYLYKTEISNKNISFEKFIKLLPAGKDTKFKFTIKPTKKIDKPFNIKFYYGKLKEIKIGDETISSYGNEKVTIPVLKEEKEGYELKGYTDLEGSQVVKYKVNESYSLKDGTILYPVYEKKADNNPDTSDGRGNNNNDNNNNGNNNSGNNETDNQTPEEKKQYTVTFDYKNGMPKTTKVVTYKEKYGDLPVGNKNGYTFSGWYLGNKEITSESIVDLTKDVTLEAKYIIVEYSISYNLNGGSVSTGNPNKYTIETATFSLNNPVKNGYTFIGWTGSNGDIPELSVVIEKGSTGKKQFLANYSENEVVGYKVYHKKQQLDGSYKLEETDELNAPYGIVVKPNTKTYDGFNSPERKELEIKQDGTSELEYKYTRKNYELVLENKENIDLTLSTQEGSYPYETEITLVAKDKVGYNFVGWNNGLTTKTINFPIKNNVTIKPVYEAKTYEIVFNSNSGEGVMSNQSAKYDEEFNLKENTFTKKGNSFIGWNTKADGSGQSYENKEKVKNLTTDESITLYAQYIANEYTITFDSKGGTAVLPVTRRYQEAYGVLPTTSKVGYNFVGWYLGDTKIEEDTLYTSEENITLEAHFEIIVYHITYNLDGGTVTGNPDTYTVTSEFTLKNPSKTGYTFAGWTGSNGDNLQTQVTVSSGTTGDLTYTAHYSENQETEYRVIHRIQKLEDLSTYTEEIEILYGPTDSKVTPAVRNLDGFILPEPEEITIKGDGSSKVIYTYNRDSYEFSMSDVEDIDLENSSEEGSYPYETEITVKAKEKEGYTFDHWSNGSDVNPTVFPLTGDITIYPVYSANKYTIVFNSNGGTGSMADQEMTYDITSNLRKNTFTKEGYSFDGWNTKEDGTGTSYEDEASVKNLKTSGNIVLYAQWEANTDTAYKVIHKKQKLNSEEYDEEVENLTGTTDAEVTPAVRNYTGFVSPEPTTVTINGNGKTEVVYIYTRIIYSLDFEDNEYIESSLPEGNYPYGTEVTITAKEKEGYTFIEWTNGSVDNPYTFSINESITIKPTYSANIDTPYKVIHKKQKLNSEEYDEEVENLKGTTDAEVTPSVRNYTGFVSPAPKTVTINGNGKTEVVYIYTREMYSLDFEDNEYIESSLPEGNYPYGTEVTITAKERPGYTFDEWTNGSDENPYTFNLDQNLEIKPLYSANTDTPYKVIHKTQKIDETYETKETENLIGTTDSEVTPSVKTYEGFTSPNTKTVTVNGDGSTEVIYEYKRNKYQLTIINSEYVVEDKSGSYYYEEEIELTAKDRQGYDFAGWSTGETTKTITVKIGASDITVNPIYTNSENTEYKVIHRYRKLTEGYDEVTINGTGTTGSTIPAPLRPSTGFINPEAQNITITADGLASVTYTYEREKYELNIADRSHLKDGSTANGEYPYGTEIVLIAEERAGYDFSWSDGITNYERRFEIDEIINLSLEYEARTDTPYKVIHKKQKLSLDGYDEEIENFTGVTDTEVTPSVRNYTGFILPNTKTVTINGDGSTEVVYTYNRENYTLTFNDDEYIESNIPEGEYPYGTTVILTAKEKQGYDFSNWSNGELEKTITFTLEGDVVISPVYTSSTTTPYKVKHRKQNLDLITYEEEIENFTGVTDTEVTPSVRNYTGFISPSTQTVNIDADGSTEVIYVYTRKSYSINYEDKENIDMINSTPEGSYLYETEITVIAKIKEGYTFKKWSNDSTSITLVFNLVDNTTIKPIYEANNYEIVFDSNGGVGSMSNQEMTYDESDTLDKNTFVRPGYDFDGWNTKADGLGDSYSDEEEIVNLVTSGEITLYATWKAKTNTPYKVVHRKQKITLDGYDIEETENLTGPTDSKVTPAVKSYIGYTSPSVQTTTINGNGNTEVIYNYDREIYTFTLGDTVNVTSTKENGDYPYGTEITLTAGEVQGYTFTGWTNGETSNPYTFTLDSDLSISPIYEEESTEVSYKVIHQKQKITLDGYDIEETENLTGISGSSITPVVKTYTGFISPASKTVTIASDGSTVVTYNYNREMYTLSYDGSTDITTSTPAGEYPYGKEIIITANQKAGYTFDKWSNEEISNPYTFNLTGNVTIKPLYIPNTNTLYKIIHRKQNLDLTTYLDEVEERFGTTDSSVTPAVKTYAGFTSPSVQTVTIAGDGSTEVIYVYTRNMYTLSFDNNTDITSNVPAGTYPYGTIVSIKANDKEGYVFSSWSDGETSNPYTFTLTESKTVTPIYDSVSYEVTFNANGGTGDMLPQTITKNVKTKLSKNLYTKSDSIFDSWNTESNGTGDSYFDEEEITRNTNITLYAIWAPQDKVARIGNTYYTSLVNAIKAVPTTGEETEVVLLKDTAEKAEIADTKKVILDLQNHTLSNNGNANVIVNNGSLKLYNGKITTNIAQGAINNNSTGTLVMENVSIIVTKTGSKQAIYNDGGNLTINGNCYLSSESTQRATLHNLNNGVINLNSGTVISTGMYAIYNEKGTLNIGTKDGNINQESPMIQGKTYGIVANNTYNFYDGIIKGITYHVGKTSNTGNTPTVSVDTDETKMTEIETDSQKVLGQETISGSTYYTIKLEETTPAPSTYTVTFNPNGGNTSETTRTVTANNTLGNLPTANRSNSITKGWYTAATEGSEVTSDTVITGNITYYAQYYSTMDQANITPIRVAMKIGDERTITITGPEDMENYTITSNDTDIATVSGNTVTAVGMGETTLTVTGTESGLTRTIEVEVLSLNRYKVTFNANGGTISETTRYVYEGQPIGVLPTGTKDDDVVVGWYLGLIDGIKIDKNYIVNSDLILYPKWGEATAEFDEGQTVNMKMKKLANPEANITSYSYADSNITSITKYVGTPDISLMTEDNIISSDDSLLPIYAWFDNGTLYWWTDTNNVYLNEDSSYMFAYINNCNTLDLSMFNSDNLTNTKGMFYGSTYDELDISSLNTSNVTDMSYMFCVTTVPSLDLSNNDFSKVEDMSYMFTGSHIQTVDFGDIETDSLVNMNNMFNSAAFTELDLSKFDTHNVTNMDTLFAGNSNLKTVDMSNWDFSGITSMKYFFSRGLNNLEEIKLYNVNTSNITDMSMMFAGCSSLKSIDLSDFDTHNVTNMDTIFASNSNLKTIDMSNWDFSGMTSLSDFFSHGLPQLEEIILDNVNTSTITNMSMMFKDCSSLTTLDLSDLDTENVTNMASMFNGCSSLTELDLSSFNTSNVTTFGGLLHNCTSLETLNMSNFDLRNTGNSLFVSMDIDGSSSLKTVILDNAIFGENMQNAFNLSPSVETISLNNVDTSLTTNMISMFSEDANLKSLDLSSFDTHNVVDVNSMFYGCSSLIELDLSMFDTSKITSFGGFVDGCTSLEILNMSNFDFRLIDGSALFGQMGIYEDTSLKTVILDNAIFGESMTAYFYRSSSIETISLNNVDTSNTTSMLYLFGELPKLSTLDLTSFDTNKVTDISRMFENCSGLTTIYVSDDFVVDQVTSSGDMFLGCESIVGGLGTTYDANHIDKEYAHYDGGVSNPGYFTDGRGTRFLIEFDPNGGILEDNTKSIIPNHKIGKLPVPTKAGSRFLGWYTGIQDGFKIDENTVPSKSTKYYAHWGDLIAKFDSGENVNVKMKKLANPDDYIPPTTYYETNITSIERYVQIPDISSMTEDNIVSSEDSNIPIYAWYDNGTIYWWSEAQKEYLNEDSSGMFEGFTKVVLIDTSFDTSNSRNMSEMFAGCYELESLNLSNFDTSNVIDMSWMFNNCRLLTELDLSSFDTKNVTTMYEMFVGCSNIQTINLSSFNTSKVTNMEYMFLGCSSLTNLELDTFDTKNVTTMEAMFNGCSSLTTLDVSNFDVRNVNRMSSMFGSMTNLEELDLSNWDLSNSTINSSLMLNITGGGFRSLKTLILDNVIFPSNMVYGLGGLNSVEEISLKNVDTSKVTNMDSMFYNDSNLKELDLSDFDTHNVIKLQAMFSNCTSLTSLDLSMFDVSNVNDFGGFIYGDNNLEEINLSNWDLKSCNNSGFLPNMANSQNLKTIILDNSKFYGDMSYAFDYSALTSISLKNVDTSNVTNMEGLFNGCSSITELDLGDFDTRNVTDMSYMFKNMSSLTTITVSDNFVVDQVTTSADMFKGCTSLVGGNGTIYDSEHIDKEYAHYDGGVSSPGYFNAIDLSSTHTITLMDGESIVKKMYVEDGQTIGELPVLDKEEYTFDGWYNGNTLIDNTYVPTTDVTLEAHWTYTVYTITLNSNRTGVDNREIEVIKDHAIGELPRIVDDSYVTEGWYTGVLDGTKISEETIPDGNNTYYAHWIEGPTVFETGNIVNEKMMKLAGHTGGLDDRDTSIKQIVKSTTSPDLSVMTNDNIVSTNSSILPIYMWYDNGIIYWWSEASTVYLNEDSSRLFKYLKGLEEVSFNDIDTTRLTNTSYMFHGCESLTNIDTSNLNTSNVIDMSGMFYGCTSIEELDLSSFDTGKVTDMTAMFNFCYNLKELNISSFNTENVTSMSNMFGLCSNLTYINLDNFNTENVIYMSSMFAGCTKLETLDLSSFDSTSLLHSDYMFNNCYELKTIYADDNFVFDNVVDSQYMFNADSKLVGGQGTTYNAYHTDKEYARIDGGQTTPGYFTKLDKTNKYEITFMDDNTVVGKRYITQGSEIGSLPTIDKLDYSFVGWYTSKVDGIEITNEYIPQNDIIIYAQFIKKIAFLDEGLTVNIKMKKLAGDEINETRPEYTSDSNITSILKSSVSPDISQMTDDNIISSNDSLLPIYAWYDNGTIYWWTDTNNVYLNEDSSYLFSNLKNMSTIDLSLYNSTDVTDMSWMFSDSIFEELDITKLDTSNVTNMKSMFLHTTIPSLDFSKSDLRKVEDMSSMFVASTIQSIDFSGVETRNLKNINSMFTTAKTEVLDLSDFDTSKVTDMSGLFAGTSSIKKVDMSNWDFSGISSLGGFFVSSLGLEEIKLNNVNTSTITNMKDMFANLSKLKRIELEGFDTQNVTNMSGMFIICNSLEELDLSSFNTSNVTDMSSMFNGCRSLTKLDLNSFDTSKVTNMSYMFNNCPSLTTIYVSDDFVVNQVTNSTQMFDGCTSLVGGLGTVYDANHIDKEYAHYDGGLADPGYFTDKSRITYNVIFDTTGGSEIPSQIVYEGGIIIRPIINPTKDGYLFDDWYTDDTYTTKFDFTTPITSDTTIYAHFEELKVCADNENITRLSENTCSNNENITIGDGIVCKRAVKLHEETCSQTDGIHYCSSAGYTESGSKGTSTITYGSCGTSGTLSSGDAFTCDVNGDGNFDELTERFYYVSDYYDTSAKEFDTSTAVLIYYNNVTSGVSCNYYRYAYDSANTNYNGPRTLVSQLPTTSQWSNVELKNTTRQILTQTGTTSTSGGTLPEFDYSGYAARLLTYQEIQSACGSTGMTSTGYLDSCNYVMENTKYANSSIGSYGSWLETPHASSSNTVWIVVGSNSSVVTNNASNTSSLGARPAIEVSKSKIEYGASSTYTVKLNANGGSVNPTSITVNIGDAIGTLPEPTPPTGKSFTGWYTELTGGIEVTSTYVPNTDIEIYAQYEELKVCANNENITTLSSTTCSNNENITVGDGIICKRAVKLHEETCSQTSPSAYCSGAGYTESGSKGTSTITYGSCGTSGTLSSGDAFTCDVNGDGNFDELTERFYYVSDYYDTSAKEFDDSTAVLIYYNNVTSGVSCNKNTFAYSTTADIQTVDPSRTSYDNWHGPLTVMKQLPTTSQWSNVELKNTTRQILTQTGTTSKSGGALPEFDYSGYAARLLIYQEIQSACGSTGMTSTGYLDSCNYIMENTKYAKSSIGSYGGWLETPFASDSYCVWYVSGRDRDVYSGNAGNTSGSGARPAIEVPKSKIEYGANNKQMIFNANGGTGTMDSQSFVPDISVVINENTFTRTNYKFTGWNTKADGTGDAYTDGDIIPANTYNNNITLYAQWIRHGWDFENESTWTISDPLTDQKWLYYDNGTKVMNGWINVPGRADNTGALQWFYMKDGYMYMGWLEENGNWYFLSWFDRNNNGYPEGHMFHDMTYNIDGVDYTFDSDGICQNPPSQTSNSTNNAPNIDEPDTPNNAPASVDEPDSSNESISDENDSSNTNNEEDDEEETSTGSNVSASIYGILGNEKNTKSKFVLPKEAYNLRRYFMGIY